MGITATQEISEKLGNQTSGVVAMFFAMLAVAALVSLYREGCRERAAAREELLAVLRQNQEAFGDLTKAMVDHGAAVRELSGVTVEVKNVVHRCQLAQAVGGQTT
jgi:hypothetical protein